MREAGYYWVKVDDTADWQPVEFVVDWNSTEAKYGGHPLRHFWAVPCQDDWWYPTNDEDLYRIHEHRIEEPIEEE